MKYYPCFIITGNELDDAGISDVNFTDGRPDDPSVVQAIEDYCGHPIVKIYPSPRGENELFAFVADGYVQYDRLRDKRTVVIIGDDFETLKTILSDIIAEHPGMTPEEVFDSYAYQTDINIQYALKQWIKTVT